MPAFLLIGGVVVGLFWVGSKAVENFGAGVDQAGTGLLKAAVAVGAIGAGVVIARRIR